MHRFAEAKLQVFTWLVLNTVKDMELDGKQQRWPPGLISL